MLQGKKYESIIENQLGTVIVSKNIDSATRLSKRINARYKVVTLDGDVVHIGGSMSGGSSYSSKSMISLKQNLLEYQNELENKQERLENVKEKVRGLSSRKDEINEIYATNSRDKMLLDQELSSKIDELSKREKELEEINSKITSYESVENNSIDQKEQELMNAYQQKSTEKDKMSLRKESIVVEIDNLKQIIEEATAKEKSENSKLRNL